MWPQFVALALTWGASFLFIKIGLEGFTPGQVVLGRLAAGSLALLAIMAVTRQALPRDRRVWGHLFVVSVLLCVFPFLMYAWAEQFVASSVASILNATTPLMTMLVAFVALPAERPTRTQLVGLLTGFLGVLVVLSPWTAHASAPAAPGAVPTWLGELGCLAATLSYGVAFVYLRKFVSPLGLPAVPVATIQVSLGAVVMLALSPILAATPSHPSAAAIAAVVALGVASTGLAYVWNTNVVATWGATNASTVTYLTPLVGVIAGMAVLGESLTWNQPAGAVIVILGIAISQGRLRLPRRARSTEG